MKHYDVIVIGSGGGAKITSPSARRGLKVACIEKDALGGTCLNRGCIPSKMLIYPADVATLIKEARKFDIQNDPNFTVNFSRLIERISNTVDRDSAGIVAGYNRNPNIDYYKGTARFLDNKTVAVGDQQLTAPKIFIGVGARPHIPNIDGLEGTPFMTSTEALRNRDLPSSLLVIGAGYIAAELGYAYSALGSDVRFLVRSHFLRHEDKDVSEEFQRVFSRHHQVELGVQPVRVCYEHRTFTVTCRDDRGREQDFQAEALLVATGVVPNTDTLSLKNTDIHLRDDGYVVVNERMETTVPGVYALGDCIGRYQYRHSVNFEGEYLFRTKIAEPSDEPIVYPPVGHAVFTHPQVAGVGSTEQELEAQGADYVVGLNPYAKSAMGMAMMSDYGFVKLLIERPTRNILGCHIIGPEAATLIHTVIAVMTKQGTLDDLLQMIYIHPAMAEIVRNAARKAQAAWLERAESAGSRV